MLLGGGFFCSSQNLSNLFIIAKSTLTNTSSLDIKHNKSDKFFRIAFWFISQEGNTNLQSDIDDNNSNIKIILNRSLLPEADTDVPNGITIDGITANTDESGDIIISIPSINILNKFNDKSLDKTTKLFYVYYQNNKVIITGPHKFYPTKKLASD